MSSYWPVAVLLLSALCSVQASYNGSGWWLRQPYAADSLFTLKAEYGKDYILNCSDAIEDVEFWVIPDMTIIESSHPSKSYFSIDGSSYTEWMDDGQTLNITMVVEDQFGFYFCHGTTEVDGVKERRVVKKAVNYQGPYFADTWEMYRMNTIVACSAAAAFLVIVGVSYCVYEWKFSDDDHEQGDAGNNVHSAYHTNNAYDSDIGDHAPKVIPGAANPVTMDSTML